jgi:hypothetical protein
MPAEKRMIVRTTTLMKIYFYYYKALRRELKP